MFTETAKTIEKTVEASKHPKTDVFKISDTKEAPWGKLEPIETDKTPTEVPKQPFDISDTKGPPWEAAKGRDTSPLEKRAPNAVSSTFDARKVPGFEGKLDSGDKLPGDQTERRQDMVTRNKDLEGKKHPDTGVPFERKTITKENGEMDEGVFPQFESSFDARLPPELYKETDAKQFAECNKQLKEAIEKNPELAKKFTPEQLEQIRNEDAPDGYTWHHNEETGKMQLVDSETHAKTGHTGGRVLWGGGPGNR